MHKILRNGNYFHVIFLKNIKKWKVKKVGETMFKIFNTKEEALKEAKKYSNICPLSHIIVHNEKGKFEAL